MMRTMTLKQLAQRCTVQAPAHDVSFAAVNTDSRTLKRGELFVALRGDQFDGHDFLPRIAAQGACAAVVERLNREVALPQNTGCVAPT